MRLKTKFILLFYEGPDKGIDYPYPLTVTTLRKARQSAKFVPKCVDYALFQVRVREGRLEFKMIQRQANGKTTKGYDCGGRDKDAKWI